MALFLVDKNKNETIPLERKTFQELGFKEVKHLQEWISKNPNMLGESLLIIQKEFRGFDDTNERLDLLAIDESGNLVIIENKLDDTGRDVTWQALKYVSYCSGLTKADVVNIFQKHLDDTHKNDERAERVLAKFFNVDEIDDLEINKGDQRIILIAANFRKEVTSTVMWLLDHNVKIKCIKVTPFMLGDSTLIDTEQIIPIKDAEDYQIKINNKKQDELISKEKEQTRHTVRMKFWNTLLPKMNEMSDLYKNISPSRDNWLSCACGYSGLWYNFVITGSDARVELGINRGAQEENKRIFDNIFLHRDKIETAFGNQLDWRRLDENKGSKISYSLMDVNVFNEDDWDKMIGFMTENMIKFEKAMKNVLAEVMRK